MRSLYAGSTYICALCRHLETYLAIYVRIPLEHVVPINNACGRCTFALMFPSLDITHAITCCNERIAVLVDAVTFSVSTGH